MDVASLTEKMVQSMIGRSHAGEAIERQIIRSRDIFRPLFAEMYHLPFVTSAALVGEKQRSVGLPYSLEATKIRSTPAQSSIKNFR